jgi:hypothetical protein
VGQGSAHQRREDSGSGGTQEQQQALRHKHLLQHAPDKGRWSVQTAAVTGVHSWWSCAQQSLEARTLAEARSVLWPAEVLEKLREHDNWNAMGRHGQACLPVAAGLCSAEGIALGRD